MIGDPASEQQALLQAVLGQGETAELLPWLAQDELGLQFCRRGLQAYRANGQALAERALQGAYPVLAELMGEENFASLARHFWAMHPPQRGDMGCWGDVLAGFVDGAQQLAGEPYLGDVARLEWLMHLAGRAADVEPDPGSFELLGTGDPAKVSLILGAGAALLASVYPTASIVNAHLLGSPSLQQAGQLLAEGCAEHVLVWRQGLRPRVRVSTAGEHRLLRQLTQGRSLLEALESVTSQDEGEAAAFDFRRWLGEAVQTGLVCGAYELSIHGAKK